jgi:ABC-type branched-chain amino acid transport systems, ATPase component
MTGTNLALEVRNIRAGYDSYDVLHGMSLHVGANERVGLFGPNGHGKTTLLNAISKLIKPTSGSVTFMGAPLDQVSARGIVERGLIHVPQANRLFPDMEIMETLELAAFTKRARADRKANLDYVLTLFPRLAERRRQQSKTLSGGERQMLSIGVGIMCAPQMLMLDEPTLGLSPKLKEELANAIAGIAKTRSVPMLIVEQDIAFVLSLVDRMYFVDHGEIAREIDRRSEVDHQEIMDMYFGEQAAS